MKNSKKLLSCILCVVLAACMLAGCGAATAPAATAAPAANKNAADTVLMNGVIYTVDANDSIVTALAVKDGVLVYVGDDEGVKSYIGENTNAIDLEGKMAAPGFADGHDHVAEVERKAQIMLLFDNSDISIESYTAQLAAYVEANPDKEVITADGLDLNAFPNGMATNGWLNEAYPDKPIILSDVSGHGRLANQAAMDLCGITDATEAPAGGTIMRDESGKLTGYFSDSASLFDGHFSRDGLTDEQEINAYKDFQAVANSYGMTTIDSGGTGNADIYRIYDKLAKSGEMTLRINQPIREDIMTLEEADKLIGILNDNQKYISDYQRIDQVKTIIDGVPEGMSALLLEPYAETSGTEPGFTGPVYWDPDLLNQYVAKINAAGYSVLIHSMGDGGCRNSVQAFKYSLDQNGADDSIRNVVVHGTLFDPADIKLAGEMGIYCATQPVWFFVDPQFSKLEINAWGQERFDREYVMRDMVDAGMIITGGADYPVTPDYSPLSAIEAGVTQGSPYEGQQGDESFVRNADQGLTPYEMLKVYTINAAKQAHFEDITGTLEVGKKADIVVLGQDIITCDPLTISETPVVYTIFNGDIVYQG